MEPIGPTNPNGSNPPIGAVVAFGPFSLDDLQKSRAVQVKAVLAFAVIDNSVKEPTTTATLMPGMPDPGLANYRITDAIDILLAPGEALSLGQQGCSMNDVYDPRIVAIMAADSAFDVTGGWWPVVKRGCSPATD